MYLCQIVYYVEIHPFFDTFVNSEVFVSCFRTM